MSRKNSPSRVHRTPHDHHPPPHPVVGHRPPAAVLTGVVSPLPVTAALAEQPTSSPQSAVA